MPTPILGQSYQNSTAAIHSIGPVNYGDHAVARAAEVIFRERGYEYSKASAPRSPHPELSGNKIPMHSRLSWLVGRAKCNQFVGDALFEAGFEMPTFRMKDGSKHYMNAERLPTQTLHFERVVTKAGVRPGDLMVIDYTKRAGENGAHVEIVHSFDVGSRSLITLGAQGDGVAARERNPWLSGTHSTDGSWVVEGARIYFLRPVKFLQ